MDWFELNNALDLLWEKQQKENLDVKHKIDILFAATIEIGKLLDKVYAKIETIK